MIRHTILFKVKRDVSPQTINHALHDFIALQNKLSGIITLVAGECHFNEDAIKENANRFFTHSISIDFENRESLMAFFNDAVTHPAKDQIVAIVDGGYNGIIGFEIG